jgi:hypothetical protein
LTLLTVGEAAELIGEAAPGVVVTGVAVVAEGATVAVGVELIGGAAAGTALVTGGGVDDGVAGGRSNGNDS